LQSFNTELVRSLEGLKERRDNIIIEIKKEEDRKTEIERIIFKLREELDGLNGKLFRLMG
jgi:hypothetical protein